MPKLREKISIRSETVQAVINQANSLPSGFPFTEEVFPVGDEKEQKKRINELAKVLPDSFIQLHPITKIIITSKKPIHIILRAAEKPPFDSELKLEPLQWLWDAIRAAIISRKALLRVVEWNKESGDAHAIQLKKDDIRFFGLEIENGVMKARAEFPFADLINENTDTRRIKQCRSCENFFWVKRLSKKIENELCEKCASAIRQKRFQAKKDKTETRIQRRKAYYRNKGVKILCEKCGRPQLKCGGC